MTALTVAGVWCVAACAAALLLGRVIRRAEETRADDLCALIDATAEPEFRVAIFAAEVTEADLDRLIGDDEPTPIAHAAWVAAVARAARIEAACEDFRELLTEAENADDLIYLMGGDA